MKTRVCRVCQVEKPFEDGFHTDKTNREGKRTWCKECVCANAQKWRAAKGKDEMRRIWRAQAAKDRENGGTRRRNLSKYGITPEEFEAMNAAQGGLCKACHRPETAARYGKTDPLCVDHCHETKKVRGLLCSRCNLALGCAKDNINTLLNLAAYLEETGTHKPIKELECLVSQT